MQSRRRSIAEVTSGTAIGFVGNWLIVLGCIRWIHDPFIAASVSTALCTCHSLCRGFLIRRYFNWLDYQKTEIK